MSAKGYSAVPTDERRDSADMESRMLPTDAQAQDGAEDELEGEPSASDRLLPFSAHDDGDSSPSGRREPIGKRATRWIRSQPGRIAIYCRAFKKRCTARGLILAAIIGFLLSSTTGLAISTGILATRPRNCWRYYQASETRIPWMWNRGSHTQNYWLNLANIYPPLSHNAEDSCKLAWASMDHVGCHEKVLNRAWDDGKQQSIFEPRYDLYSEALGRPECSRDLENTYQLLSSQCTGKDTFDTSDYIGPMTADPYLEEGPVAAMQTLLDRVRHTSRRPPANTEPHWLPLNPCVAELYQDWFIVDGKNSGNLNGLDAFLKSTVQRKSGEDRSPVYRGYPSDGCDDAYAPYRPYWYDSEKRGPNDGDTKCSWCLINWLDRKLQSWEEGKVYDPKNDTTVSLPSYLRTIEHAGRRCQAHDWERIYKKNIWTYQEKGWLPDDWEEGSTAARRIDAGRHGKASYIDDWMDEYAEAVVEQTW